MNLDDVREKLRKKNQLLFSRESACLQELLAQIRKQSHRTLVAWAFLCLKDPVERLKQRYPQDPRPEAAVIFSRDWAAGKIRMPAARPAILAVHRMAKELSDPADAALCHAVGQGCSTVHVETHAIGLPIYELTALVREYGLEQCEPVLASKLSRYQDLLRQAAFSSDDDPTQWAAFLRDDSQPNKEQLLLEKQASCSQMKPDQGFGSAPTFDA